MRRVQVTTDKSIELALEPGKEELTLIELLKNHFSEEFVDEWTGCTNVRRKSIIVFNDTTNKCMYVLATYIQLNIMELFLYA